MALYKVSPKGSRLEVHDLNAGVIYDIPCAIDLGLVRTNDDFSNGDRITRILGNRILVSEVGDVEPVCDRCGKEMS